MATVQPCSGSAGRINAWNAAPGLSGDSVKPPAAVPEARLVIPDPVEGWSFFPPPRSGVAGARGRPRAVPDGAGVFRIWEREGGPVLGMFVFFLFKFACASFISMAGFVCFPAGMKPNPARHGGIPFPDPFFLKQKRTAPDYRSGSL